MSLPEGIPEVRHDFAAGSEVHLFRPGDVVQDSVTGEDGTVQDQPLPGATGEGELHVVLADGSFVRRDASQLSLRL